jgi:hypothetical protein
MNDPPGFLAFAAFGEQALAVVAFLQRMQAHRGTEVGQHPGRYAAQERNAPQAAEFFGFWGMSSKLAAVVGILGLGMLQGLFGLHVSILFCLLLFVLAVLACLPLNQARGRSTAEQWEAQEGGA